MRSAALVPFLFAVPAFATDVCLFDAGARHPHEKKLTRIFAEKTKGCSECRLKSFPIYDDKGEQTPEIFLSQLAKAKGRCSIIHLSWNIDAMAQWKPVSTELSRRIADGVPVVGAAGRPEGPEVGAQFARTVLGEVKNIVVIGELDKKKKLEIGSYHGPEILTALAPPLGEKGSSFSAILFTARWAKEFSKHKPAEWLERFRANKETSRDLWPSLDELFANPKPGAMKTKKEPGSVPAKKKGP